LGCTARRYAFSTSSRRISRPSTTAQTSSDTGFEAGPDWHEVKLTLADYSNVDWTRVRAIGVGTMGPVGRFRFQIDNVRLE